MGAALFGPRVKEKVRNHLLDTHNIELVRLITAGRAELTADPWHEAVAKLLTEMQANRLGKEFLGLTTKTVQEMAMASEDQQVQFALSVLYSLLYAPLLYFHDVQQELQTNEMIALEAFDVDFGSIVS